MKYKVTLNDKTYEIEVEQGQAILVDEYEAVAPVAPAAPVAATPAAPAPVAAPAAAVAGEQIVSPMPGTIVAVKCAQGEAVKKGQTLVVLEAMKMENDIVAPRDGTVAQLAITKGAVVETSALLVVLS